MSDYPCDECHVEGRGPFAHSDTCSQQKYSGATCVCGFFYLLKGQKFCEKCMKSTIRDFRGIPLNVGQHVVYAGRKPSGSSPRGRATLIHCLITAIDPVVKRVHNIGNGPKITLQVIFGKHARAKTITTRDLDKLAVIGE